MIYLLDTNVWVAILRTKYPQVAARYGATNRADIRVCSAVVSELHYGCAKSAKPVANRATLD
jgi:predicted nucleic acid-binding protein